METNWTMPEWMIPYAERFIGRDQQDCEYLVNVKSNVLVNAPLSLESVAVSSKVRLLEALHRGGSLKELEVLP